MRKPVIRKMQTICAHCYTRLSHRRQRTACILCTRCEQNWAEGNSPAPDRKLPEYENDAYPFIKATLAGA